jgi:hypothetical protein
VIASAREIIQYLYAKIVGLPPEVDVVESPPPEPVQEAPTSATPEVGEMPASEEVLVETPEE